MSDRYQAILFDLDGTLLNTLEDLAEAVNQGLVRLGRPVQPLAAFRYFVGDGREAMVRRALSENDRNQDAVKRLVEYVDEHYTGHWRDRTQPYAGVPELLDSLFQKGMLLTVFSNKPHEFTSLMVEGLLNRWSFTRVLGASSSVPHKPDCTGALRIATELGISPSRFIYLGDSGVDMQTARRAGMYAVGALWGYRDKAELLKNGAQALIEKPMDLLRLL